MVGLAFTQHSTPPDLDDPSYTARADFLFDARRNELDILSAYASPERIPKKRQGAYNTLAFSNEGRAFIVDNQTLEGEPAPNAELACGSCTSPWRSGSPGTTTSRYHHLGFAVTMTTDRAQLPLACGYIAARATGAMFAATNCWRTVDLSDAAARKWVDRGNAVLDKPGAAAHMLETQDVYTLVQRFHEHESDQPPFTENDPNQAWPCQAWPLTVSTLDWFARSLASTVMDYAAGGWQQAPKRAFYVTNTQDCRGRGAHWISVAIGLRWVSPPPL